jgi:hypothetical protein
MKVKLVEILQELESKIIPNKKGGSLNIYSWLAILEKSGTRKKAILKTFSEKIYKDINNKIGQEIEVEEQEYKGSKSYVLKAEKRPFNPGGRPPIKKVNWIQFETACVSVYNLCYALNKEKAELLFDKMMGCASVILDFETVPKVRFEKGNKNVDFNHDFEGQDSNELPPGVM